MTKTELQVLLDRAGNTALDARRRIEAAVDSGDLPVWLLDTINEWERATMLYGAARAQLHGATVESDDVVTALLPPELLTASGRRAPGSSGRH